MNKKFLIILLGILIVLNIAFLVVDKAVPDSAIKPTFVLVSKIDEQKKFDELLSFIASPEIANKVQNKIIFQFVGPNNKNNSYYIQKYKVNSTSALLIISQNGKLIERSSAIPSKDALLEKINKYSK